MVPSAILGLISDGPHQWQLKKALVYVQYGL